MKDDTIINSEKPKCDFCSNAAEYDAKTKKGPWAFMCLPHWKEYRFYRELGCGKGQKFIEVKESKNQNEVK